MNINDYIVTIPKSGVNTLHRVGCNRIRSAQHPLVDTSPYNTWRICKGCNPDSDEAYILQLQARRDREAVREALRWDERLRWIADNLEDIHPFLPLRDFLSVTWPEVTLQYEKNDRWYGDGEEGSLIIRPTPFSFTVYTAIGKDRLTIKSISHSSGLIKDIKDAREVFYALAEIEFFRFTRGA